MSDKQVKIGLVEEGKPKEDNKPKMFLRRGVNHGLYFFSPLGTTIYYMNGNNVKELLEGKRDFVCIDREKARKNEYK